MIASLLMLRIEKGLSKNICISYCMQKYCIRGDYEKRNLAILRQLHSFAHKFLVIIAYIAVSSFGLLEKLDYASFIIIKFYSSINCNLKFNCALSTSQSLLAFLNT